MIVSPLNIAITGIQYLSVGRRQKLSRLGHQACGMRRQSPNRRHSIYLVLCSFPINKRQIYFGLKAIKEGIEHEEGDLGRKRRIRSID